jgi:ketosteroid isomerase-like protein
MSAEDNVKTIQLVYEAFGRGEIDAITDAVTDDVDWASETTSNAAPWYGIHHGKAGVAAFFEAFGSTMEVEDFTPLAIGSNDSDVFAVIRFRARVRASGRSLAMHLHHYFRLRDGKVYYYRGTEDSAITAAALAP